MPTGNPLEQLRRSHAVACDPDGLYTVSTARTAALEQVLAGVRARRAALSGSLDS
jgi:hypothetical protein